MSGLLPHSIEAEEAVLGSILIDPDLMSVLELEAGDFYRERHQVIFAAMRGLWDGGFPIDWTLLVDELERTEKLPEFVKPHEITGLLSNTPTALYGTHYAAVVKRAAVARQYIAMAGELAQMAFTEQDGDAIYGWVMERLATINNGRGGDKALTMWDESFPLFRKMLADETLLREMGVGGWPWPWPKWNELLGDAQPGGVVYIAAASGVGKTIYAENIAEWWAKLGKRPVLVHLELNKKVMFGRRMARHAGLDFRALMTSNLSEAQLKVRDQADAYMQTWAGRIHYLHAPGWTAERIVRELRRLADAGECDCFLIDYSQKIKAAPTQMRMLRADKLLIEADNIEQLKNFAEEREMRGVVLGQLTKEGNRDITFDELDPTKLRGTQEIVDKVNVVVLPHRERLANGRVDEHGRLIVPNGGRDIYAKVKVGKNTFGPEGVIEQVFTPEMFMVDDR